MQILVIRYCSNMLRKKLKLDPLATAHQLTTVNQVNTASANQNTIADLAEQSEIDSDSNSIAEKVLTLELDLNASLKNLQFKQPVAYVYHPLDYAYKPHSVFIQKYCKTRKKVMFVGMNPGPWGMCQTGIPFGEVKIVKDWFKIQEEVSKPKKECRERKVLGLDCPRSEISGQRIWGLFRNICGTPESFFKSAFMYNYCPIAMMKDNGSNITPTEIKGDTRQQLEQLCDETLYKVIQLLEVEIVVGVGKFAETRVVEVLKKNNPLNTKVFYLLHPSPRVPKNQNWLDTAEKRLNELNLMPYFKAD